MVYTGPWTLSSGQRRDKRSCFLALSLHFKKRAGLTSGRTGSSMPTTAMQISEVRISPSIPLSSGLQGDEKVSMASLMVTKQGFIFFSLSIFYMEAHSYFLVSLQEEGQVNPWLRRLPQSCWGLRSESMQIRKNSSILSSNTAFNHKPVSPTAIVGR